MWRVLGGTGEGGGRLSLTLLCLHQNHSALRWAAMTAILMFPYLEAKPQDSVYTNQNDGDRNDSRGGKGGEGEGDRQTDKQTETDREVCFIRVVS